MISGGGVVFDNQGQLILEQAHAFNDSFRTNHIFLKELFAATWAIKALLKRDPGAHEIHITVDNSAAAAAHTRGRSSWAMRLGVSWCAQI